MIDLRRRSTEPELMDIEAIDLATFEACLRDLERINRWTGAYRITLRWLERLLERHGLTAAGRGRRRLGLRRHAAPDRRLGRARDVAVDLIGVDLNPHAAAVAARATPPGRPIRYLTGDVFELSPSIRPDVVISALFAHHLDDAGGWSASSNGWTSAPGSAGWSTTCTAMLVPYWIARCAPPLLRMNRLVRHDAPVSVARAFERRDWERLLASAGLAAEPTTVAACFPFRFAVGRIKPPP